MVLVDDLIKGQGVANTRSHLLASGGVVWLGNNISFALLYWLIDSGARAPARKVRSRWTWRSRST